MADAPEVYHSVPQGSPPPGHTGPFYGGPRPESEGLQVHSAYAENYNKAPYSDNPALGPQGQYVNPPMAQQQQGQYIDPQQQQYVNPPLGHQTMYAENQPGGFVQVVPPQAPQAPQLDEKAGKKRICGLSVLVFWGLIIAAVLIVVGAVVGGVVGSQKSKESNSSDGGASGGRDGSSTTDITTTPTVTTSLTSTGTTTTSASASATAAFEEDTFYRLTNKFLGSDFSVDIRSDNGTLSRQLNMTESGNVEGQNWQIKAVPEADGRYWFASQFLGKGFRLVVDSDDRVNPLMARADDAETGQQWNVKSKLDGTWRISNALVGEGALLSTYSDTYDLFMDLEDDTGTVWTIAEVKKITTADDFL